MRVFSEPGLRETLRGAGFDSVDVASADVPEFGVEHAETWSLPVAARKGRLLPSISEMALGAREFRRRNVALERELATIRADYQRYTEFHQRSPEDLERQLAERAEWVRKVEHRTAALEKELAETREGLAHLRMHVDQSATKVRGSGVTFDRLLRHKRGQTAVHASLATLCASRRHRSDRAVRHAGIARTRAAPKLAHHPEELIRPTTPVQRT
jgi:hypothetical protein